MPEIEPRNQAGRSDVEPVTRSKMKKSAIDFEDMALTVLYVAASGLDCLTSGLDCRICLNLKRGSKRDGGMWSQ